MQEKDGSVTIHHRNLQFLATEMFKVTSNFAPAFMKEVFGQNTNVLTENISANPRLKPTFIILKKVYSGLETVGCCGPKIWSMVPDSVKKWTPVHCPCRLCKDYISQLGYV